LPNWVITVIEQSTAAVEPLADLKNWAWSYIRKDAIVMSDGFEFSATNQARQRKLHRPRA